MQKQADWSNLKNILCVRLDNLGDVIMTSPAIRALKEQVPGRKTTLLTSRSGNAIAKYIPEIDEIITFDTPWEKNAHQESGEGVNKIVEELKSYKFDGAVIFTVYSQNPLPTAMICYMAGIPNIAGYCRENPYQLINHWVPETEPLVEIKHEVNRQLDLVSTLGAKVSSREFSIKKPAIDIEAKLNAFDIDLSKPFIVVHPGVSEAKRQFSLEVLAEASRKIAHEDGYQILLTGVESEKSLTEFVKEQVGEKAFSLAGKLSLDELIALLDLAPLLISNNTGPVHIAAALKTPVVVLYALTNPQHTPWRVRHTVLPFDVPVEARSKNIIIKYAYEKCFSQTPEKVTADDIVDAVKEILKESETVLETELLIL